MHKEILKSILTVARALRFADYPSTDMEKNKITIEHLLRSTSKNIIWKLIATGDGLAKWIADSVLLNGDHLTLTWGDSMRHHEERTATIVAIEKFGRIRWHWDDDDEATYVEIRMDRNALTGEYTLHITDFTDDDDKEWLYDIWNQNFERLYRSSGV